MLCALALSSVALAAPVSIESVSYTHLDVYKRQVQEPVEHVGAPVVEGAAGDLLVGPPPLARLREAAHVHLDVEDIADQSVLDDLLQSQEVTVVTPVVEDGERLLALLGRRDHLIGLLDGDAHRLLEDDMLARVEALDGQLGICLLYTSPRTR